jgi:hypothetical protein
MIVDPSTSPYLVSYKLLIGSIVPRPIAPEKLRAIGRMGGNEYSRTRDRFEMLRPRI